MELKQFAKKHGNRLWAFGLTAVLFGFTALCFDFYYDLNDDVLIKDVLSGVYSGSPDGHTMQLLFPLGFLLSVLYRFLDIPVFGIFLCVCQFLSVYVISFRTAALCKRERTKAVLLSLEGIFFAGAFLWHLVFIQYTVTAGMLCAAAVFLVVTGKTQQDGAAAFLKDNAPALSLFLTGFCLRSEMGLLLLPLAGCAGLCRWGREVSVSAKKTVCKYVLTFAVLTAGLLVCILLDSAAYSGGGWPAFRQFFDDRTELYDYRMDFIREYDENRESYERLGVTGAQQALLDTYNFGVDDSIDASFMSALRAEAVSAEGAKPYFRKSMQEGFWMLKNQHLFSANDFPLNLAVLALGAAALLSGLWKGRRRLFRQTMLCLFTGGGLWMFLLMRDRYPSRITAPLYLAIAVLLFGLLLSEKAPAAGLRPRNLCIPFLPVYAAFIAVLAGCLWTVPGAYIQAASETVRREEVNSVNEAVFAYCSANPAQLFLADVYSTVEYTEKLSKDRDKPFNYDLLGGWLVKSPLSQKKLSAFGFSSMGEAVRTGGRVRLLTERGTGMDWLNGYFAENGMEAEVFRAGTIAEAVDVWQVLPKAAFEQPE